MAAARPAMPRSAGMPRPAPAARRAMSPPARASSASAAVRLTLSPPAPAGVAFALRPGDPLTQTAADNPAAGAAGPGRRAGAGTGRTTVRHMERGYERKCRRATPSGGPACPSADLPLRDRRLENKACLASLLRSRRQLRRGQPGRRARRGASSRQWQARAAGAQGCEVGKLAAGLRPRVNPGQLVYFGRFGSGDALSSQDCP